MAWTDLSYSIGSLLTAAKMTQLYDNIVELPRAGTVIATTSGTAHDFTGIPAGSKLIIVSFSGVSFAVGDTLALQLGDSGGIENGGYVLTIGRISGTTPSVATSTTDFTIFTGLAAGDTLSGVITLALLSAASNLWAITGTTNAPNAAMYVAGSKSLSAALTSVRILGTGGQTFDAGSINILYQ